ncbi:hypothetical protein J6590_072020, partial [Homalodisca vitripennis]
MDEAAPMLRNDSRDNGRCYIIGQRVVCSPSSARARPRNVSVVSGSLAELRRQKDLRGMEYRNVTQLFLSCTG